MSLPDWAADEVRADVQAAVDEGNDNWNAVAALCFADWVHFGQCDEGSDWEEQARGVARTHFNHLRPPQTHPDLTIDRGDLEARIAAFKRLHDAGAYLVEATPEKRPAHSLKTKSIIVNADGSFEKGADGKFLTKDIVQKRAPWWMIEQSVRRGGLILYYGCGYQGIAVLDFDPLIDEAKSEIIDILGPPVAAYHSSGRYKSPDPSIGKVGGYGGHLVYKVSPDIGTHARSFAAYQDGPALGELFSFSSHRPPDNAGFGFIVWDPIAVASALDAEREVPIFLLPTTTKPTRGGGGARGGRHGWLIDKMLIATFHCATDEDLDAAFDQIKTEHAERVRRSEDLTTPHGRARLKFAMGDEPDGAEKWVREKMRARMEGGWKRPEQTRTDKIELDPDVPKVVGSIWKKPKIDRDGSPEFRAMYLSDRDPDPKRRVRGKYYHPRTLARMGKHRSDWMQHAIRVIGGKQRWRPLTREQIMPFYEASRSNGLMDLVGVEGVIADISNALDFVLEMRVKQLREKQRRIRMRRKTLRLDD